MTTTAPSPTSGPARSTLSNSMRSEWTKLLSLRSTVWTLGCAFAVSCGVAALTAASVHGTASAAQLAFVGLPLGSVAIALLGVFAGTSEYSNGMMRTTLVLTPRRGRVLAAKALVTAALAFFAGLVINTVSLLVAQALLSTRDAPVGAHPLWALIGGSLYLAGLGVFALSLGIVVRSTSGAMSIFAGIIMILPVIAALLPGPLRGMADYLPGAAGSAMYQASLGVASINPWLGFLVFAGSVALALAAAGAVFRKRDA